MSKGSSQSLRKTQKNPGIPLSGSLQGGGGNLVARTVHNPPTVQESWVRFLGQEDPLEKGMATTPAF